MGTCETCLIPREVREKIYSQLNKSICQLRADTIFGTGIFCKISFPSYINYLKVLIANTKFLTGAMLLTTKNNIEIPLFLNENRKYYINEKNNIVIVEIKDEDGLNINTDDFLEVDTTIKNKEIYMPYYRPNTDHRPYYLGELININNNDGTFVHSCKSRKGSLGAPIISYESYKVIGINKGLIQGTENSCGMLINKFINEFQQENTNINIIFHLMDNNKEYTVKAQKNMMFGEMILYFYFISGLKYHPSMTFVFNDKEINCYSCDTLNQLNIQNNSKINVLMKTKVINDLISVVIDMDNTKKVILNIDQNISFKELLMVYSQKIRLPYKELILNSAFLFNNANLLFKSGNSLKNLGIKNFSKIELITKLNF